MDKTEPRIIIFTVSGTIALQTKLFLSAANSFVAVFGQTAPGDGIALKGPDNGPILAMSFLNGTSAFHDGLFQHLRFRHGMPIPANSGQTDNISLRRDTFNVVFDHNSFTWAGDEVIELWGQDIHDITFSHNLFAEGAVFCRAGTAGSLGQNVGPLLSGGSPKYNVTFHHNVLMHMCFRNYKVDSTNGGGTRGFQFINNVHYNNLARDYGLSQNLYNGRGAVTVDVISDYFKQGPDANPGKPFVVLKETSGSYTAMSLHLQDSTFRNQDGSAHAGNDEADNFASGMFGTQNISGDEQGPTWTERGSPISPQPTNAVTTTTAAQAYTDLIINEDVGATMPSLDAVDQRLIDDPEDGGAWSSANVPPTAPWPTLTTSGVPTDTDSDGVPDAYETILGTDPNVFESQAVLDHDGDGYKNIEEWIHSLSQAGSTVPAENKPNPPVLTAN